MVLWLWTAFFICDGSEQNTAWEISISYSEGFCDGRVPQCPLDS
ncbi:hypothetical protein QC764_0074140 [Podospora pseudoanserina]|uniref:Uncharacterized protein n=1 Tax=Podospora pseudoanserina TaxID=2609844 RepID=A0ABR0I4L6_9PEZI|nr:hypothetical protein QC764_0074140 [Podospora pseudoanserina]